jgi:glutamate dehydrogenase
MFVERGSMILADAMPMLEHLGLRVIEADALDIEVPGKTPATIHTFVVQDPSGGRIAGDRVGGLVAEALLAVHTGLTDDDRYNSLVITAGLEWPEVAVLRAYAEYAFQIGAVSSRRAVTDALVGHPDVARWLFELFRLRFDPRPDGDRASGLAAAGVRFNEALRGVASISHDLTHRRLRNLVEATVRTNYFKIEAGGERPPVNAFKLDCAAVEQMPHPRPAREIYVHGPDTAGSHLRFGPVARGGIRWSERRDDFRTEVLSLVKTQQVKNAVIVPSGAKGAFIVRRPPADPEALKRAVLSSYREFIRGMLDITDNVVAGRVVHPADTVVYDDQDPYFVVAADKGTAAFSDTANQIADEYAFWMGDAFASGGSHGYDHKKEGITARGTWGCVRLHFREMGKDINREPVTVTGIGDMSGDVFGNGMLLSRSIKLIAAFDHRHIFIDPDPDPAASYLERQRLFEMPGSSWEDYDRGLISEGGGVYPRGAKEIALSPEARKALDVEESVLNGQALIRAILKAPVELLWNGGIGTYVKSTSETNADVGDSTNDAVRINADELRVKVIGEGGNLGLTQLARIEYALEGGRLNTDALDNSAGVDMSDHEVNLKILLRPLLDRGQLSFDERNTLLEDMSDDVAASVLSNNHSQSRALSLEQRRALERTGEFRDASYYLERRAGLKRSLEFLPGWGRLQARHEIGKSMVRPELAVLLAYSKMHLKSEILASALPDDPQLIELLEEYFPARVIGLVSESDLREHRLQREIIATVLTNKIVDLMGSTFIPRVSRDTGANPAAVARGWYAAAEIAGARELLRELERGERRLPAEQEYRWLLGLEEVLDLTVRWAVENLPVDAGMGGAIAEFKAPVAQLAHALPDLVHGSQKEALNAALEELKAGGVPGRLAPRIAALQFLGDLMEVTRISHHVDRSVLEVGQVYFALADEIDFAWLIELLKMAPGEEMWEQRAAQGLMQDLGQARRNLTLAVIMMGNGGGAIEHQLAAFRSQYAARLTAMREILEELLAAESINLAAMTVASREILRQSQAIREGRA